MFFVDSLVLFVVKYMALSIAKGKSQTNVVQTYFTNTPVATLPPTFIL